MNAASGAVLAYIPSPDRGVWHLGPIPLRAYALCIIVGIVVAIWWGERRFAARGGERGTITDVAVFAVPFGLVGGRLYHVATDHDKYFGPDKNPLDALKVWNGGLGIWGAIALGAVGAWIACRRKGIPLPAVADAVAPGIVVAQAIGRLGNFFNQELYGGPTTLPWGLEVFRRVDPATGLDDPLNGVAIDHTPVAIVHPTFLYELLWNLGVAALVVWADRRFRLGHGRAFALYVAGYTAGRFWIELMRADEATHVLGVRINVITSAVVFLGAVGYFLAARTRGPREDLAALRAGRAGISGGDAAADVPEPATGGTGETVESVETAGDAEKAIHDEAAAGERREDVEHAGARAETAHGGESTDAESAAEGGSTAER
ncbi:prolipoprotein diacylglyceryl transferase [Gandjariella thermophila]|uniref:prolipoprotein diacylglyceryl transferase n=1 Tax=Gandjariella thermophila TaxID=1931992 RepID=UPI0026A31972